jgi:hypothetical protein
MIDSKFRTDILRLFAAIKSDAFPGHRQWHGRVSSLGRIRSPNQKQEKEND